MKSFDAARIALLIAALAGSGSAGCGNARKMPAAAVAASSHPSEPDLAGRVTDAAHILNARQAGTLERYLVNFEASTRHQMVIVTVPTLGGRNVSDYTRDLANHWGIGRKGVNDGIVILVAPNEQRVRIAVGYGLEKLLTQDYCAKVIQLMTPSLRQGRYYEGLMIGATGLARMARRV